MRALLGLLLGVLLATPAAASWPERPVTIVVPFAAGAAPDVLARLYADRLSTAWGRPVVVQNVPGAGGTIGVDRVAKAAPDGYTLIQAGDAAIVVRPSMSPPLPYDPGRDFTPVTLIARTPNVLVAAPTVPAATVPELVALARTRPGELTYAYAGPGTSGHVGGAMLAAMAGVSLNGVAYAQAGQQLQDLLAGRVAFSFLNVVTALPHVREGRLRALGVSGATRLAQLPEVPTVAEQGHPEFEAVAWFGLLAPAGTPQAVVGRIQRDVAAAFADPALRERLTGTGAEPVLSTPEAFRDLVEREIPRMASVVRATGMRAE